MDCEWGAVSPSSLECCTLSPTARSAARHSRRLRGLLPHPQPEAPLAVKVPTRNASSTSLCAGGASRAPHSPEVQEFVAKRTMTPLQEVANALSMIVPGAWVLWSWQMGGYVLTWCSCLLLSSSLAHVPFSVFYHLRVALSGAGVWPLACTIDNTPRRLDQTGIHLVGAVAAYALSGGSVAYSLAVAAFNAFAIRLQWQKQVEPLRNQRNVGISVVLYVTPMIWRRDWANIAKALTWGLPGAYCFAKYPLGGYSHAIFHVLTGGVLQALVASTQLFVAPADGHTAASWWLPLEEAAGVVVTPSPWWARGWWASG